MSEWSRDDALGFWGLALCIGLALGGLYLAVDASRWIESGLLILAAYFFTFLLTRTWTEGRV